MLDNDDDTIECIEDQNHELAYDGQQENEFKKTD